MNTQKKNFCEICCTYARDMGTLSCSHRICKPCIVKWYEQQRLQGIHESCPYCRNVDLNPPHEIFFKNKNNDILFLDSKGILTYCDKNGSLKHTAPMATPRRAVDAIRAFTNFNPRIHVNIGCSTRNTHWHFATVNKHGLLHIVLYATRPAAKTNRQKNSVSNTLQSSHVLVTTHKGLQIPIADAAFYIS